MLISGYQLGHFDIFSYVSSCVFTGQDGTQYIVQAPQVQVQPGAQAQAAQGITMAATANPQVIAQNPQQPQVE